MALEPLDVDLRWELADTLLRAARWDEARTLLDEGLVLDAEAAKMHFGIGLVELLQAGNAEAALVAFESAREQAPYLPNLNYQRGVVLERLERLDESLAAYVNETARQPRHYPAQFSRARLLAARGAPLEEVIAALRLALAASPGEPRRAPGAAFSRPVPGRPRRRRRSTRSRKPRHGRPQQAEYSGAADHGPPHPRPNTRRSGQTRSGRTAPPNRPTLIRRPLALRASRSAAP